MVGFGEFHLFRIRYFVISRYVITGFECTTIMACVPRAVFCEPETDVVKRGVGVLAGWLGVVAWAALVRV